MQKALDETTTARPKNPDRAFSLFIVLDCFALVLAEKGCNKREMIGRTRWTLLHDC